MRSPRPARSVCAPARAPPRAPPCRRRKSVWPWTRCPFGAHRAGDVEHRVREPAPVDRLHGPLGPKVVRAEKGGHPGGVARATDILEQQGVEQLRALLLREPQALGDGHPDIAGADGVPLGLAFDHVQDEGQRREHLRVPECPSRPCTVLDGLAHGPAFQRLKQIRRDAPGNHRPKRQVTLTARPGDGRRRGRAGMDAEVGLAASHRPPEGASGCPGRLRRRSRTSRRSRAKVRPAPSPLCAAPRAGRTPPPAPPPRRSAPAPWPPRPSSPSR